MKEEKEIKVKVKLEDPTLIMILQCMNLKLNRLGLIVEGEEEHIKIVKVLEDAIQSSYNLGVINGKIEGMQFFILNKEE